MNRENFKRYKAVIIGGGASGLVSAIRLANEFSGDNICVLERLDRVGKKILSTGNGQGNITNEKINLSFFHGKNPTFCEFALKEYDNLSVINFYKELGLLITVENGKIYPMSKQASSVLDALRFKVENLGISVITNAYVKDISVSNNLFTVKTESGNDFFCENVILAVGGKSAKHLGTDGSSYSLYEKFGHKTSALYPSLVQLKAEMKNLKGLKGLKQKVNVKVVGNENIVKSGDILFTDYGVSGNAIFGISSYLDKGKGEISVDFCPEITEEDLNAFLTEKIKNCNYLSEEYLLSGIINNKIGYALIKNSGLKVDITNIKNIVKTIKNYKISITGTMGFDYSQVTNGGLLTEDFDNKTMQSKLQKGLYAIGEVLDIDGDCGGYNLQWAFSSAMVCGRSIK